MDIMRVDNIIEYITTLKIAFLDLFLFLVILNRKAVPSIVPKKRKTTHGAVW